MKEITIIKNDNDEHSVTFRDDTIVRVFTEVEHLDIQERDGFIRFFVKNKNVARKYDYIVLKFDMIVFENICEDREMEEAMAETEDKDHIQPENYDNEYEIEDDEDFNKISLEGIDVIRIRRK